MRSFGLQTVQNGFLIIVMLDLHDLGRAPTVRPLSESVLEQKTYQILANTMKFLYTDYTQNLRKSIIFRFFASDF